METLEPRQMLTSLSLDPVSVASIQDSNFDGFGDQFNTSTPWLLRQIETMEDRAVAEFNVSELATVDSASLTFELAINNGLNTGTRYYSIYAYAGNGQSDISDFSISGQIFATASITVAESIKSVTVDATSVVQSLVDQGADFVGFRIDPLNSSAPSVFQDSKLNVTGTTIVSNTPPTILAQNFSTLESVTSGSVLGRVVAYDVDAGQSVSYRISAGNEAGLFEINSSNGDLRLASGAALDFETRTRHTITISVTDNGSPALTSSANVSIIVRDANDIRPYVWSNQTFHVAEDATDGTAVGTVNAGDMDTVGTLQGYAIVSGDDAGVFAIDPATGAISVADSTTLDFDVTSSYSLGVQVSDGVQLSAVMPVIVRVDPLPQFTAVLPVFQASIHDEPQDGTGDSFSATPFEGLLRQQSGFREDRAVAEFAFGDLGTVAGGTLDFTLDVNNSLGTVNRNFGVYLYGGNGVADLGDYSIGGHFVGTVSLPNYGPVSYRLNVSSALNLLLASGVDFVGLRVDPINDSAPSILIDPVIKVNLAPTVTLDENPAPILEDAGQQQISLTGITAGGREDQPLAVSVSTDNSSLIGDLQVSYSSPNTAAVVSYVPAENRNGTATISVTVADAGIDGVFGNSDDNSVIRQIAVTVLPVNDAPVLADGQSFSVEEHAVATTVVGTLIATDVENHPATYSIVSGNESGAFQIDAGTGLITVTNPAALDFEVRNSYSLVVRASDRNDLALTDEAIVAIYVLDVAEPSLLVTAPIKAGASAVSVAILSDSRVNAVTDLNIADLRLRIGNVDLRPKAQRRNGFAVSYSDVNGDGRVDLVITFEVISGSFVEQSDAKITLLGSLTNGSLFSSHSSVSILPAGKGGGKRPK